MLRKSHPPDRSGRETIWKENMRLSFFRANIEMGGEGGAALHKTDRDGGLLVGDLSRILSKLFPSSDEAGFHVLKYSP